MAPPAKKTLASKEASLFKELLTLYETRQLKKGVKTADQILKRNPDNGETLCMKGLLLTHMGRREEGLELVKKGILLDLTSHIVWHVYGLIQKGQKDYEGALKSFTQALRYEKENLNLLNDAANLQTQVRQFEALRETREIILKLRPNVRKNWLCLAVAYHLCGDLAGAKNVMESYMNVVKNVPDYDYEHSELTLYQISIREELGEYSEALSMLDMNAKSRIIIDRKAVMECRARLLTKLESSEAEESWRSLIDRNPDCYDYYRKLFALKGLSIDEASDEKREDTLKLLDELASQYPKAAAPRRIALVISLGDDFKERARTYLLEAFKKGVPSIFTDVKSLYKDPTKSKSLEEIVLELKTNYASESHETNGVNGDATPSTEPVSAYLWILYYLAQHYSFARQFEKSLALIDEAIKHTPTLPELYTCKARCLKRVGDLLGAAGCMEDARVLDKADRFLNTKSAKYQLRAGLSGEAQAILGLFTKKDAPSPGYDLEEMQSLLYLTEEAGCQKRMGKLGPALKKYLAIHKVLDDFRNDQYDFHYYSIRRATIRTYMKMLKWEDDLFERDPFVGSAIEAAKIYVRVHDDPSLAAASRATQTDAERKAQKKAKKAAAKNQEAEKKGNNASNSSSANDDKGLEPPTPKDEDLDGMKALAAPDGLDQAWKLLKPLAVRKMTSTAVCVAVYDIAVRQKKYLQAARALLSARSLNAEDPELHVRIVDFKQRISSLPDPLPARIASTIDAALSSLYPSDLALPTYNSQYLQRNAHSARSALAAARVLHLLHSPLPEIEETLFSALDSIPSGESNGDLDAKTALEMLDFLEKEVKSVEMSEAFRERCDRHERFKLSTVFKKQEEIERLKEALKEASKKREEGKVGPAAEGEKEKVTVDL